MSTGARVGFFLIAFSLLFSSAKQLYAAENTNPPVVESITGPTSGIIGETYTFSTVVSSITNYDINIVNLLAYGSNIANFGNVGTGAANCTVTSCTLSSSFTPSEVGTYIIYVAVNYDDLGEAVVCVTRPEAPPYNHCQNSSDKYITFVVTDGTAPTVSALPSTGVSSTQTKGIYIGLGFITIGTLVTQSYRLENTLHTLSEKKFAKRRSRFEKKF